MGRSTASTDTTGAERREVMPTAVTAAKAAPGPERRLESGGAAAACAHAVGAPKLFIFDRCRNLVEQIRSAPVATDGVRCRADYRERKAAREQAHERAGLTTRQRLADVLAEKLTDEQLGAIVRAAIIDARNGSDSMARSRGRV